MTEATAAVEDTRAAATVEQQRADREDRQQVRRANMDERSAQLAERQLALFSQLAAGILEVLARRDPGPGTNAPGT